MKKIYLVLVAVSMMMTGANAQNLLLNGDCETQGAWKIADQTDGSNTVKMAWDFGMTGDAPTAGTGGYLEASFADNGAGINSLLYQTIKLKVGETYEVKGAIKDMDSDATYETCSWLQIYLHPVAAQTIEDGTGVDYNPKCAATVMLDFDAWKAGGAQNGKGVDGTWEDLCTEGNWADSNVTMGDTTIYTVPDSLGAAGTEVDYYFAIKVGVCGKDQSSLDFAFDEFSVMKQGATSIATQKGINADFDLYPNPAANSIRLSNANNFASVSVINILGKNVMEVSGNQSNTLSINVSSLAKGTYIVKINTTDNNVISKRFVKL